MNKETVKKLTLILFVTLVSFLILPPLSASAGLVPCGLSEDNPDTDWDETTECDLCGFLWMIKNVMDLILKLGGVICFLIVVSGGILLLVAGGSENFIAIGKKILTSAIIGLVIILSSWLIISAIFGATGYNYADNWYEFECEGPAPPTPTYLTCKNGACVEKDGDKDDECKTNEDCRHRECKGMVCETINQPGTNTCDKDKDCYHLACDENFDCVKTEGKGTDECSPESSKCPNHLECARYGKCILVAEEGPNKDGCTSQGQTCSAWHLDCNPVSLICEKVLGGGKDRCEVIDTRCRIYYLECREGFCTKIWDIAGDDECEKEGEPCEAKPACDDGEDNDRDKRIDFPDDPGCTSKDDNSEKDYNGPQCDNGKDDDGDNKIDYKADGTGDPECTSPDDNDEANGVEPCTKDSDCELGYICKPLGGGQKGCVPGCREDPDCPTGQICENGSCVKKCRDCQAGQKPVCYKRHDRCPGGTCTEFKCCSGCVCECRGWDCVWMKDYCYPSEEVVDPFEGYTLQVTEKQKDHASQDLMDLLACMKDKLPEEAREISSISDDGILSDPVRCDYLKCSGNICGGCCKVRDEATGKCIEGCAHGCNSCHYGGRSCNTQERFSYAVDFAKEEYCDEIKKAALECNAGAFVNYEGGQAAHVHVSVGKVSGCGCDTGTGKGCP